MFKSKYSNFLTIILIVAIVFVIVLVSILAVNAYKRYKNDKDAENAISRFENNIGQNNNTNSSGQNLIEQNVTNDTTGGDTSGEVTRQVTYYNNFVMIGYIEIPKINIKYPILEKETVPSLEQSVAVRYPDNPKLNEPGNVVIAGHNYRNGQFFSNLKKKFKFKFFIFGTTETEDEEKKIEEEKRTFELKTFIHKLYKNIKHKTEKDNEKDVHESAE